MKVKILPAPSDVHDGVSRYVVSLAHALAQAGVSVVHAGEDYDVLHLTAAHRYDDEWRLAKEKGKRLVVTVHDLIPEHFHLEGPQYAGVPERAEVLASADAIIAVSEYTKEDLVRTYGIAADRITVVHNGVGPSLADETSAERTGKPDRPYLLWVGRRAGYKNFFWFVRSIAPLLRKNSWDVVCTGGQDFGRKERLLMLLLGVRKNFRLVKADDADLACLYRKALCLVMPSRAEGFGLPIVEAMSNGCPVVVPRAHVFPEIAGDAALYFDQGNASMLRQLVPATLNEEQRAACIAKGLARVQRYSWTACAEQVKAVYAR